MNRSITLLTFGFLFALAAYGQRIPCGIGAFMAITHRIEGDRLQIFGVASNSPAARAGLAANQLVRTIDGVPTVGMKFKDCVKRIQGEAGTKVVLEIEDKHHGWTNSVEVTREIVADDPLAVDTTTWVEIPDTQGSKSLSVTTNKVIRVSNTNGAIALILFTKFGTTNASYHWRFRSKSGGTMTTGAGIVFEDYDGRTNTFGSTELIHRGNPDDLKVKVGNFQLEWSSSSFTNAWLYFYPSREKVEVLDSSAFDSGL